MEELNLALFFIGGLTLVFSLLANFFTNRVVVLSAPLAAMLLGIVIGPAGAGLLDLAGWGDPMVLLEQTSRIAVAIAVMASALRLPIGYFHGHVRTMTVVLTVGMAGMWVISALLAHLLLGLPFWLAVLLGAVVTPTDPVLAGSILTGDLAEKTIPERLRNLLTAEAGANDGGALPLVLLAVFMLSHPPGEAWQRWLLDALAKEVALAVALGLLIGFVAGRVERWTRREELVEKASLLVVSIALAGFTLGAVKLAGGDGLLAVFVAGLAYRRQIDKSDEHAEERVQEAINRLVGFPMFALFGMALPWQQWLAASWTALAFALLVLLLRRPPLLLALSPVLPPLRRRADALFTGWFGPVGAAAIFYATFAVRELGHEAIWVHASSVVCASIVLHGVSATPLTKRYGSHVDG